MIRGAIDMLRKLPPRVKIILGIAVMAVILHPRSREKLIEWAKMLQERLWELKPTVLSISRELVKYLDEAAKTSRTTREAIKAKLQVRGNQTALAHARFVCLRSTGPLSADEIARRILANGYSSRSKTFTDYVRCLLRKDGRFVVNAKGLWMLRAAA